MRKLWLKKEVEMKQIGYLLVYFTGEKVQEEQIYFSVSKDGRYWTDLNDGKPVIINHIGEKGVRDPFILKSQIDCKYYILGTDLCIARGKSWEEAQNSGSNSILIWSSDDLVNWSEPRMVPVCVKGALCAWAPEAIYDKEKGEYLVFWASKTQAADKQIIFCVSTKDFVNFSEPMKYMERPYDVIDTTIIEDQGNYYRFFKDETDKFIRVEKGVKLKGTFAEILSPALQDLKGVEGAIVYPLPDGETWCLLVDQFAAGKGYLPLTTRDLDKGVFEALAADQYDLGLTTKRHGSVLMLDEAEWNRLLLQWSR